MSDTRPRVPLNGHTINLTQLAAEVGAALCASATDLVVADPAAAVSASALQAALDAHVADPNYGRPAEDSQFAAIRDKAAQVFAGQATFTAAELQKIAAAAVLRLARR